MSYEGYELWLCKGSHIHTFDSYSTPDSDTWKCPDCQAELDRYYLIDQTNGTPYPVNFSVEEILPPQTEQCESCGHKRQTDPAKYKIINVPLYLWSGVGHYPNQKEKAEDRDDSYLNEWSEPCSDNHSIGEIHHP